MLYGNIYKAVGMKDCIVMGDFDRRGIFYRFIVRFSDMVGLPLQNTTFQVVLMKSIGAAVFNRMPFMTSTTCVGCNMCYVFNVNVTDSFDDRWSQCRLI